MPSPFNPNDAPPGHIAVKIPGGITGACRECAFDGDSPERCYLKKCSATRRADGQEVYFIPTLGSPPLTDLERALALLKEVEIEPSTDWADRRASLLAKYRT
jgi:hypothetical protein